MKQVLFCVFIVLLISVSCKTQKVSTVQSGIEGTVTEETGNQMPMVGGSAGAPKAFKTTVYIYDSTNISKAKQVGTSPLFLSVNTRLVQKLDTDEAGRFSAALPAGTYSVFVLKGGAFFANQFDEKNNIGICRVEVGKQTHIQIKVNSDATY
ncbi:MAG: hypothetical protein RJA92_300 [Bacteroidota bacterium]